MADTDFTKLVPGFDFLQSLVKNAGSALPSMGQWVAPTLSPEEIEKRIDELKTVQFWLEQNARMLAATIQALEVQRMTLSTLKTMNVQMGDLRDSLKIHVPEAPASFRPEAAAPAPEAAADDPAAPARPAVDPMQWWGALTKQFSELAASAIQEGAAVGKKAAGDLSTPARKKAAAGAPAKKAAAGKTPARRAAAKKRVAPKR
jgi:hypothetical protein